MSDHQNENALRIAAYLENRLSPEEREAFKRALSEDDELRLQYVDALMSRAGPGPNTGQTGITMTRAEEPGWRDETVTGAMEPGWKERPGSIVIRSSLLLPRATRH